MGFHKNNYFTIMLIFNILCVLGFHEVLAMRPINGEPWLNKILAMQSLQKGTPTPPSGPNPCTNIPGSSRGRCTLSEINVAGHVAHAPPAFPDLIVSLATASIAN
jgi:hypothetical protein